MEKRGIDSRASRNADHIGWLVGEDRSFTVKSVYEVRTGGSGDTSEIVWKTNAERYQLRTCFRLCPLANAQASDKGHLKSLDSEQPSTKGARGFGVWFSPVAATTT
ncbi:hypothetical protein V6N13_085371 [Hibiscus sabdariffa]|uniref:Uncharacterized protein n=1 Tax=Hibiscus sabdariffa TaxID=183260 RepID=A0ABR2D367_9ROSI